MPAKKKPARPKPTTTSVETTIDVEIAALKKYKAVLHEFHKPSSGGPSKILIKKAGRLCPVVQNIYESYRVELGLPDAALLLNWPGMFSKLAHTTGFTPISLLDELICKLEGLSYKKENIKTLTPLKEEYTTKEVCKMLGIAPSTFCGYKSKIDDFPEPIDPEKIPHIYSKEAVSQIRSLVGTHRNSLTKKIPTKTKQTKKITKKHLRT